MLLSGTELCRFNSVWSQELIVTLTNLVDPVLGHQEAIFAQTQLSSLRFIMPPSARIWPPVQFSLSTLFLEFHESNHNDNDLGIRCFAEFHSLVIRQTCATFYHPLLIINELSGTSLHQECGQRSTPKTPSFHNNPNSHQVHNVKWYSISEKAGIFSFRMIKQQQWTCFDLSICWLVHESVPNGIRCHPATPTGR